LTALLATAGTKLLLDITPGTSDTIISSVATDKSDKLTFKVGGKDFLQDWETDGTTEGTRQQVKKMF
jgi:hypothetical protein